MGSTNALQPKFGIKLETTRFYDFEAAGMHSKRISRACINARINPQWNFLGFVSVCTAACMPALSLP